MHSILCDLMHEDPRNLVFLCGAGISYDYPTNLPTVAKFVIRALEACNTSPLPISAVKNVLSTGAVSYRFEVLINEIRKLNDPELRVAQVFNTKNYNEIHDFLGQMVINGASIVTTNFDNCIENSIKDISRISRIVYTGNDLSNSDFATTQNIVKIHGSNPFDETTDASNLVITIKELAKTNNGFERLPNWNKYIYKLLENKTVVVIGYSGSDEFDVMPVLQNASVKRYIWLEYNSKDTLPIVKEYKGIPKIETLAYRHELTLFSGQIKNYLTNWATEKKWGLNYSIAESVGDTVSKYVNDFYKSDTLKKMLSNQILLNYSQYLSVLEDDPSEKENTIPDIILQKMKAFYRLGRYEELVSIYELNKRRMKLSIRKIQALYFYAASLYYLGNTKSAIIVSKRQLKLARQTNDDETLVHSLVNLGSIYDGNHEFDKAKILYEEAYQKRESTIEGEVAALWGLADVAANNHEYNNSLEYYLKAANIYKFIGHEYSLAFVEMNIGMTQTILNDYSTAEEYLISARNSFVKMDSRIGMLYSLMYLITLYIKKECIAEYRELFADAFDIVQKEPTLPIVNEVTIIFCYCYNQDITAFHEVRKQYETVLNAVINNLNKKEKHYANSLLLSNSESEVIEAVKKDYLHFE